MTEREKFRTLGTYYIDIARNYEKGIESFEALVKAYPADDAGHGNLAIAYMYVGDIAKAQEEVRRSLEIYPKNSLQRYNYAMYSMYAADFAERDHAGGPGARREPDARVRVAADRGVEARAGRRGRRARGIRGHGEDERVRRVFRGARRGRSGDVFRPLPPRDRRSCATQSPPTRPRRWRRFTRRASTSRSPRPTRPPGRCRWRARPPCRRWR